jgi:hypothetical protein
VSELSQCLSQQQQCASDSVFEKKRSKGVSGFV